MYYSFIIPAYNESERLATSLPKVLAYIRERQMQAEVIVVNDGSTDGTAEVTRNFAGRYPEIRLLENPGNRGKGYSVRNGMLHANGDVLLFTDADLSSPIYEATKLFAALEEGADVAIGSRWLQAAMQTERQPWYRQLYGRLFNLGLRIVLGLKYRDTQCGFKAFTRAAIQTVFSPATGRALGVRSGVAVSGQQIQAAHCRGTSGMGPRSPFQDQSRARRGEDGIGDAVGPLERSPGAVQAPFDVH